MEQSPVERIRWRDNPNAVELGFDHYLTLLETRLRGEDVSLVQGLRRFYQDELGVDLRDTQARGLMHRSSSVFIDYVKSILGTSFRPNAEYWEEQGVDRFVQWRDHFYHVRDMEAVDLASVTEEDGRAQLDPQGSDEPPQRRAVTVNRVIRDSALSRFLKSLYDYRCQICRLRITLPGGRRYAESHHVRPLGRTHRGIDKETNMVVLCPNHHAMMDFGAIAIHPERITVITSDKARPKQESPVRVMHHTIDKQFLEYHLDTIFGKL